MYTEADETLFVYSVSDLNSSSATYPLGNKCYSALITDNRLYIGGDYELNIFEVTSSLTEPLKPVIKIHNLHYIFKILRVGDNLLLG